MNSKLTLIFDVDGTLCPLKRPDESYADLIPDQAMLEKLRSYHSSGAKIILFSSRGMRTFGGDLDQILTNIAPALKSWLIKWKIPYDELRLGKPWPGEHGFYIDDRAVRPDEFLSHSFDELEAICKNSTRRHHA